MAKMTLKDLLSLKQEATKQLATLKKGEGAADEAASAAADFSKESKAMIKDKDVAADKDE